MAPKNHGFNKKVPVKYWLCVEVHVFFSGVGMLFIWYQVIQFGGIAISSMQ